MGWEVPKSKFRWPNVSSAEKMDKSELPKNEQHRRIAENGVLVSRQNSVCVMGQSFAAALKRYWYLEKVQT